jgi:hypothetical protein
MKKANSIKAMKTIEINMKSNLILLAALLLAPLAVFPEVGIECPAPSEKSIEDAIERRIAEDQPLLLISPRIRPFIEIGKESAIATLTKVESAVVLGSLSILTPGVNELSRRPLPEGWQPLILRSITLGPIASNTNLKAE